LQVLRIIRTTAAVRAATRTLNPMLAASRARLGEIPPRVWGEPYMLGLVMTLITLMAQHRCGGRLSSDDLGLVQLQAWSKVTGMPDDLAGEQLCRLSAGHDELFEWGCVRAGHLFAQLRRESDAPSAAPGDEPEIDERWWASGLSAETPPRASIGLWQLYFDERVQALTS